MTPVVLQNMHDFELDRYGIRSVRQPAEQIAPQDIDLVLVPGVAFDREGGRLGMGAGYYDRFLPLRSIFSGRTNSDFSRTGSRMP
mgnify:CR=1 FL=1